MSEKSEQSIYQFIKAHIGKDGNLKDNMPDLPDEHIHSDIFALAHGYLDAQKVKLNPSTTAAKVNVCINLLKQIALNKNKEAQKELYNLLEQEESLVSIISLILKSAEKHRLNQLPHFNTLVHKLAFHSSNRNSVKLGLSLLPLTEDLSTIPYIKTLALHEEFTLFAAIAISSMEPNGVFDLWDIAKRVQGWGKIHVVSHLVIMELPPEIQEWMLRSGFKNSVMNEYLAFPCAHAGKLHLKIEEPQLDAELFKSIGKLILALINDGPSYDIRHYRYAGRVIERYTQHASQHSLAIDDFIIFHRISEFLNELYQNFDERQEKNGWTEDHLANCLIDINLILKAKEWEKMTLKAARCKSFETFWYAKEAARILNLDLWDIFWHRLLKNPSSFTSWIDIVNNTDSKNAKHVIHFAEEKLPLDDLGGGPKLDSGLGSQFVQLSIFELILSFVGDYPGLGEKLLLVGLDSPVVRVRFHAIKSLRKWSSTHWTPSLRKALEKLKEREPDQELSTILQTML